MPPARLALRLTGLVLAVTALGMGGMALYVTRSLEHHAVEELRASLTVHGRLLQEPLGALAGPGGDPARLLARTREAGALAGARVTVVAPDGRVLADSAADPARLATMENHAARPEVRAALAGTAGSDVRQSETLGVEMLYVAVPLRAGGRVTGALRLALAMPEVARTKVWIRSTVAAGALAAFGLAAAVGLFVGRRVTRPVADMTAVAHRIAEGRLDALAPVTGSDEIAGLGRALNRMALSLREQIARLEGERARVDAILDGMVEGVVLLDARDRIVRLNPAGRRIFGLEAAPADGRPFLEVVRQKEVLDVAREARAGPAARREIELGPPVDRVLLVQAAPVALAPDGPGTLLVLHDVTEIRRLERVKTEFVGNVSHELRTPLTCIRGYLETLLDGALEDPAHARRFLEVAGAHAERLGRLVDDLLQLSNIETGKVVLVPRLLDLAEVAGGVLAMLEREAARRGVRLLDEVPRGLAVLADRDRVAQILVNLVDNAVKFTPAGGRVAVGAGPTAGGGVEVRVADTGIGIPSTDLPRITERFYRVDKARSRELGGTGLGLAIVKHLVQAHGGELRIASELGRGTTVAFTLPGAAGPPGPAPAAAPAD